MSTDPNGPDGATASKLTTAQMLRRSFDASFAASETSNTERVEDLLAIRIGADPHVLRLSQIAGLSAGLKIAPLPTPVVSLLGIVGVRGSMAPIYDLAVLLGYPRAVEPRWTVFVRAPQTVGFAFETFESHLQLSAGSVAGETVRAAGALRRIIDMPSVVTMLKGQIS
jgi:chemotaxis signal transduction protein